MLHFSNPNKELNSKLITDCIKNITVHMEANKQKILLYLNTDVFYNFIINVLDCKL